MRTELRFCSPGKLCEDHGHSYEWVSGQKRHPPVCLNYRSEQGCVHCDKGHFRPVEAEGEPSKKWKKGGAKGSVAILKQSVQLVCASQDSYPRRSIFREQGKLGSKHTVKFSKGTWHQIKIRERTGPSRGIIQRCGCTKKDAPAEWEIWRKIFKSSRIRTKLRFILPLKQG